MKIVNKFKLIRAIVILILITTALLNVSIAKETVKTEDYLVSAGETLWTIAEENKEEGTDTRDYIYSLKKVNNMTTSDIYDGQVIKIIK